MKKIPLFLGMIFLAVPALAEDPSQGSGTPVEPSEIAESETGFEGPDEIFLAISRERDLLTEMRASLERERSELELVREAVQEEIARLSTLRDDLGDILDRIEASENAEIDRLVAVYEAMKPEEAARLLDGLDMSVTMMIFSTMAERRAAPILAQMDPVRVQAISRILVEMAKLPEDRNFDGIRLR